MIHQLGLMETDAVPAVVTEPPELLQLAAHPCRWRLLGELARSDRTVQELTGLVGQPQNLVSYHCASCATASSWPPATARSTGAIPTTASDSPGSAAGSPRPAPPCTPASGSPPCRHDRPGPGGGNRIRLIVDDADAEVARLRAAGLPFRNDVVPAPGGSQVLVHDPSGDVIEIFRPAGR